MSDIWEIDEQRAAWVRELAELAATEQWVAERAAEKAERLMAGGQVAAAELAAWAARTAAERAEGMAEAVTSELSDEATSHLVVQAAQATREAADRATKAGGPH